MAQPLKINTYVSIVNKAPQEYPVQTRKTTILEISAYQSNRQRILEAFYWIQMFWLQERQTINTHIYHCNHISKPFDGHSTTALQNTYHCNHISKRPFSLQLIDTVDFKWSPEF